MSYKKIVGGNNKGGIGGKNGSTRKPRVAQISLTFALTMETARSFINLHWNYVKRKGYKYLYSNGTI